MIANHTQTHGGFLFSAPGQLLVIGILFLAVFLALVVLKRGPRK
jgi:hypothetical protein